MEFIRCRKWGGQGSVQVQEDIRVIIRGGAGYVMGVGIPDRRGKGVVGVEWGQGVRVL